MGVWDIAAGLNKCREVHGLVWGGGDEVWESETSREQTPEQECALLRVIEGSVGDVLVWVCRSIGGYDGVRLVDLDEEGCEMVHGLIWGVRSRGISRDLARSRAIWCVRGGWRG